MAQTNTTTSNPDSIGLLWGAGEIARELGVERRTVYHLLDRGHIPGAKKLGGTWCIPREVLREFFLGEEAA